MPLHPTTQFVTSAFGTRERHVSSSRLGGAIFFVLITSDGIGRSTRQEVLPIGLSYSTFISAAVFDHRLIVAIIWCFDTHDASARTSAHGRIGMFLASFSRIVLHTIPSNSPTRKFSTVTNLVFGYFADPATNTRTLHLSGSVFPEQCTTAEGPGFERHHEAASAPDRDAGRARPILVPIS